MGVKSPDPNEVAARMNRRRPRASSKATTTIENDPVRLIRRRMDGEEDANQMAKPRLSEVLDAARQSNGVGSFEATARRLLCDYHVVLGPKKRRYLLREIEFYLFNEQHADPFTHKQGQQFESSSWYFHRAGESESAGYRGGTYKGLDISFGGDGAFGGILIRAIERIDDRVRINGPSLVVDEILDGCSSESIPEFVKSLPSLDCDDASSPLHLVQVKETDHVSDNSEVMSTPRVGLSLKKHHDNRKQSFSFITRRYRWIVNPSAGKLLHLAVISLHSSGVSLPTICERLQVKESFARRCSESFDRGKRCSSTSRAYLDRFLGKAFKVDEICELCGALD